MHAWDSPAALTNRALKARRASVESDLELAEHAQAASVSPRALEVLVALQQDPGATVDELAERLVLQRRRVQRLLSDLHGAALIGAHQDAEQHRRRTRPLTETGLLLTRALRDAD